MKNTFGGLITRLDMAEQRISELEDRLKRKKKKDWKKIRTKYA